MAVLSLARFSPRETTHLVFSRSDYVPLRFGRFCACSIACETLRAHRASGICLEGFSHRPAIDCLLPSPIGYWIYEAPRDGEPAPYADRNCCLRWDFPFLQGLGRDRVLDVPRTREFLNILLDHPKGEKALLELHLHGRLNLASHPKLRFQQCNAARHDDHIHYQIRNSR